MDILNVPLLIVVLTGNDPLLIYKYKASGLINEDCGESSENSELFSLLSRLHAGLIKYRGFRCFTNQSLISDHVIVEYCNMYAIHHWENSAILCPCCSTMHFECDISWMACQFPYKFMCHFKHLKLLVCQNPRSGAVYHATYASSGYAKKNVVHVVFMTHIITHNKSDSSSWPKKRKQHHHCLVDNAKRQSKNMIFQAIGWNLTLNSLLLLVYWHSVGSSTVVTVTRIC